METAFRRIWFLTWRTYGTWLPGDIRGYVGLVRDDDGRRVSNNDPAVPMNGSSERIETHARSLMKGDPIFLSSDQAIILRDQLIETCQIRSWTLRGSAILPNHVHVLIEVDGDPEPSTLLRDLKSYGSRALNLRFGKPINGSWWSESGSARILKVDGSVESVERYIDEQQGVLVKSVAKRN